jgi:hypothetical protein
MKIRHNKFTHEQIRIALEQFYVQGAHIKVLPPQDVYGIYSKNYAEIMAEVESFDEVTNFPKDSDFALKNSLSVKPLLDSQ